MPKDAETLDQTKPVFWAVQVAYRHVDSNTRQKAVSYLQHITRQD